MSMMPLVIQNLDILEESPPKSSDSNGVKNDNNNISSREAAIGDSNQDEENVALPQALGEAAEGAIIVVGDNDSVSSLDSTDSFLEEDDDENDCEDISPRRRRRRRKPKNGKRERRTSPRQRNNKTTAKVTTPGSARRPRVPRAARRSSIGSSSRLQSASHDFSLTSPSMPQRQRTREPTKRPLPILGRNHSSPELNSPSSRSSRDKTNSHMAAPRESLENSLGKGSTHSLDCFELFLGEEEEEEDLEPHQPPHLQHQTSGQSSGSGGNRWNSDHQDDGAYSVHENSTNSRWSASTGTGHRSMNTLQLDQLSTVPRAPRRQKTGENIQKLRSSTNSQDSKNSVTEGGAPKKKRPQLPNRQKSFRRNAALTMTQAARVMAGGQPPPPPPPPPSQPGQNSPQQAPTKPRRTISIDTTHSNNLERQQSLPNLINPPDIQNNDPLSISMHHGGPRLPRRRASGRVFSEDNSLFSDSSHHGSTIRRAKSDGGAVTNGKTLHNKEDGSDEKGDDEWLISTSMHSATCRSASSSGVPKMPRRQSSHENMPPPAAAVAAAAQKQHDAIAESQSASVGSLASDDDDDDDSFCCSGGPIMLPTHLQQQQQQPRSGNNNKDNASGIRLPIRQVSHSERRDDGDTDDNEILQSALALGTADDDTDDGASATAKDTVLL